MNTKIIIDQKVYSNLVKLAIQIRNLLQESANQPQFNKEWLSIAEITQQYGLSRKIIDRFKGEGLKVYQKKLNGKILICRSDLEKFLKK